MHLREGEFIIYTYVVHVHVYMYMYVVHVHVHINVVLYYRRLACLKYVVLANMLMKSAINPFDSQEVSLITYIT